MNRLNLFYISAFLPLLLIIYLNIGWPFAVVVPIYAFVLLLIKKDRLPFRHQARHFQMIWGLLVMIGSFFVYYALVPLFKSPAFYGGVNYAVYILGLFLIFFEFSAIREAIAPAFLLVAASSTSLMSQWLEHHFSGYMPHYLALIVAILNGLGISATHYSNVIVLYTAEGPLSLGFAWACLGVHSTLIFLIMLVVTLLEESVDLRTKLVWGVAGVFGTFLMNVIRLVIIFVADFFYGASVGGKLHYFIGYVLFTLWLAIFFYSFSKKQVLSNKIVAIWQKLRSVAGRERGEV